MKQGLLLIVLLIGLMANCQKKGQGLVDSLLTILQTKSSDKKANTQLLVDVGAAYLQTSNYTEAFSYLSKALAVAEELNDENLKADCYHHMATINFFQKNFNKSDEYNNKALAIYTRNNNLQKKAALIKRIADDYLQQGDSLKANVNYDAALVLARQTSNRLLEADIYCNKSIIYNTDYENKILMALAAKKIYDSLNAKQNRALVNIGNIGIAYMDIVRVGRPPTLKISALIPADKNALLKLAEAYFNEAIAQAKINNDLDNASYFTGVLAELQELKGDYKNAYKNIRTYYDVQDSIYSQANKNKIANVEGQREIALRDKEIALNKLSLEAEKKQRIALIGGIALLGIIGALLFWQNHTRKKTNKALLALNKELDEANKLKARFFGILSHDLRSPISNLVSFLHLQKNTPDLLTQQQVATNEKKITAAAETLLDNMEAMLLWSKGQMKNFQPLNRKVAVEDLFEHLQKTFADYENIQFSFSNKESLVINTDENYLRTIMQNLTANAVKALKNVPSPAIEWKAYREDKELVLSITDNGKGISSDALKPLFEESSISGSQGLGLHIVRDLAKAINCTITFTSTPQAGTTFYLRMMQ